jgi:hypothetical protein
MAKQEYALLGDCKWLVDKYTKEQLSTSEVAWLIGCTKVAVREALKRHNIDLRSAKETNAIKYNKYGGSSRKYEQLNDTEWLRKTYESGLSTVELTKIVGAKTANSVRQALLRAGIEVRTVSDGLTQGRDEDNFIVDSSVLTGCLLGDGFLSVYNKRSDASYPCFRKKNKFKDHVELIGAALFGDASERIKEEYHTCNGKSCRCYTIRSLCHKELLPWYREWYPEKSGYKKVIPENVLVDEKVLLHWFLDDGSSSFRHRKYPNGWIQRKEQITLTFSSQSFIKDDQEMICEKVKDKFCLRMAVVKCNTGTGWLIRVPQKHVGNFFDIIGPCHVPSLAYKWKGGVNARL